MLVLTTAGPPEPAETGTTEPDPDQQAQAAGIPDTGQGMAA
jgi:hypothetical protein